MTPNDFVNRYYSFIEQTCDRYNISDDAKSELILYILEKVDVEAILKPEQWLKRTLYLMQYSPRSIYNQKYKFVYDNIEEFVDEL